MEGQKEVFVNEEDLHAIVSWKKENINKIYEVCRNRCILSNESEYVNSFEINCLQRCTYKFTQTSKLVQNNISNLLFIKMDDSFGINNEKI